MKNSYIKGLIALCAAAALGLSACDNTTGIFSSIETETTASSTSTFYRTSVQRMAALGGNYFVSLGAVYARPIGSGVATGWLPVTMGSMGTDYYSTEIAGTDSYVYAVVRKTDSANTMAGIYRSSGSISAGTGSYTGSFADAGATFGGSAASNFNVQTLYSANNCLFAVTAEINSLTKVPTYTLWATSSADSVSFVSTGISDSTSGASWIPGVVWAGSYYWTVQGYSAYYSADGQNWNSVTVNGVTSANASTYGSLSSIAGDSTNSRVFAGTTKGYVACALASDPSSWSLHTAWGASSNTDAAAVTALIFIPGRNLLVAGRGMRDSYTSTFYGYYEISMPSTSSTAFGTPYYGGSSSGLLYGSAATNYTSKVKYLYMNSFYYDSANARLFLLGNASTRKFSGLWSDYYGGSAWEGWLTE